MQLVNVGPGLWSIECCGYIHRYHKIIVHSILPCLYCVCPCCGYEEVFPMWWRLIKWN